MRYPTLPVQKTTRQMVDVFRGYDHNLRISEGSFYRMENMTSDHYPVLSPRKPRGLYGSPERPTGLICKDALCYVDGRYFVMGEHRVDMGLMDSEKSLVSMGAYVIILPDKKYINTLDLTDWGSIEAKVTTDTPVSFTLCREDGSEYVTNYTQANEPEEPEDLALWVDTSSVPHALRQWSESAGMWVTIGTTYIKITCAGIGVPFDQYDGVSISGLKDTALHDSSGQQILDPSELAALDGSAVVWDKGEDYIVVIGIPDVTRTISDPITVSRAMPTMDYVVEAHNRLFGCRYGLAENGQVINEIYVSKLGSFKNWNCFMGVSTDSYRASCGTDGPFTGAITLQGMPLFFKENHVHKVYGEYPANFRIQDTACRGVQKGCHKSLVIVNETVFYKSGSGVCAYDGSLPVEVSAALGEVRYSQAVAGAIGNKYYISMTDGSEAHHLFVYDVSKRMWHREDGLRVEAFCACDGELYAISGGKILALLGSGTPGEEKVKWMVETGPIGLETPDRKYISRLTLRLALELGTAIQVYIQYDQSGPWEQLYAMRSTNLRSFSVPVRPRRCDSFRLKISGQGMGKLYAISKTIEQGSEID